MKRFCLCIAVILVTAAHLCAAPKDTASSVSFAPSETGALTAWSVAGPFFSPRDPSSLSVESPPVFHDKRPTEWRLTTNYQRETSEADRPENAGFRYLFCCIGGRDKSYTVTMAHRLPVRIWVAGELVEPVLRKGNWGNLSILKLEPESEALPVLVEVRAGAFTAQCADPDIRQIIPQPSMTSDAEIVAASLSVSTASRGVKPGEPFSVSTAIDGSRLLTDKTFDVTVTLESETSTPINTKLEDLTTQQLRKGRSVEIAPAADEAIYTIFAGVSDGKAQHSSPPTWTFNIGKLHESAKALIDEAAKLPSDSPKKAGLELRAEKLSILFSKYLFRSSFCHQVRNELLNDKSLPSEWKAGLNEYAYLSELDNAPQPYLVYVPRGYEEGKPAPLLVYLHGYMPELNKVDWKMMPTTIFDLAERNTFLIVAPFARGNTDFQGVGEDDVLKVMDLVKENFAVDEKKIFLTGISMGASGVWTIAAHHPHLFAGAIPVAGRNDYFYWNRDEDIPPYADLFCRGDFAYELATNFRNLPVFCIHGTADTLVEPTQSSRMLKRLKEIGCDVTFVGMSGYDHWIWEEAFALKQLEDWLNSKELDPTPSHVTYKTYSTKFGKCYWLETSNIENWGRPAQIEGIMAKEGHVEILTRNTGDVAILAETYFKNKKALDVQVNGAAHKIEPIENYTVVTGQERENGKTRFTKGPRSCGPFREVFSSSFKIVHGANDEEGRKAAETFGSQWCKYSQGRAHIITDDEVSKKIMRTCNLVLVGSAKTNTLIAKASRNIPFALSDASVTFDGNSFDRRNTGFIGIYPSPFATDRYVGLIWGEVWGTHVSSNHTWDHVPDFLVFTCLPEPDGGVEILTAGYFDSSWQFAKDTTWRLEAK